MASAANAEPTRSRWRSAGKIVAVNAGFVLAVVVAAELIFGSWLFGPSYGDLNLPRNTVRQFDVSRMYVGGTIAVYKRDQHGLRGQYRDLSRIDILTIGGSTTNELYISEGETWPDRLAENFARAGRPLTMVNAGVDGQSTVGMIRNFEAWFPLIPNLKARYVLAYVGINDLGLGAAGARLDGTKFDRMKSPETARRVRHYLMNNSVFYDLFRRVRGMIQARVARVNHQVVDYSAIRWREDEGGDPFPATYSQISSQLTAYRDRLKILIERIRAFGATPVLITQHKGSYRRAEGRILFAESEGGISGRGEYVTLTLFNRETLTACRETGAICVDLGGEIEFRPGDFYDHAHTTPAGSKRVADFLYEKLKERIQ
jgi:lysophospholipase L1-like esterase